MASSAVTMRSIAARLSGPFSRPFSLAAAAATAASSSLQSGTKKLTALDQQQQEQRASFSSSQQKSQSEQQQKDGVVKSEDYHMGSGPNSMRAVVFWEHKKPMTIEDLRMPRPIAGEVLVKTKACGVCHSDLHVIKNDQPYPCPVVLGHEITGEVVEHGPNTDPATQKRLPVGSKVVGSFVMPCGGCFYCVKGQEDICETFFKYNRTYGGLYDGTTRLYLRSNGKRINMYSMGGLAEYCVVPANALAVLAPTLPYAESCILGCAIFTAYGAVKNGADMRAGETIAVIGTGGVGSGVLQVAKAFGGRQIIAVDITDAKLESAKKMGATHGVNGTTEDVVERIKEITGGRGVDIAVEALGKASTFGQVVQCVREGGKAVMVGLAASGAKAEVDMAKLVRREVRIIGSYGARARADLPTIISLAEMGLLNIKSAVTQTCSLEEAEGAYAAMDRGEVAGRAIVEMEGHAMTA